MARIPMVAPETLPVHHQHIVDFIVQSRGRIGEAWGVFLNSPEAAHGMARLGHYLRFESVLPPALRELAILTIAREVDSQVEWTAHEPLARQAGVRAKAIVAVRDRHAPAGRTEEEALIVRYGQELARQHRVSAATFQAALQRLGAQGIIDLTVTVGYYTLTGLATNALDIQLGAGRPPLLPV